MERGGSPKRSWEAESEGKEGKKERRKENREGGRNKEGKQMTTTNSPKSPN